jgi:peptide/nickel transport system substrate-binding protein
MITTSAFSTPQIRPSQIGGPSRTSRLPGGGLAALLAVALGVGGCGGDDRAGMPEFCQEVLPRVDAWVGSFEQPTGERYGGTVVVGTIGELPGGMNGLISADHSASQHQIFVNLTTLVRLDGNFDLQPYLAESWELNEDGTELTFRIREGVYWHDGTPTTARDVAFTYLRATDPATAFPNSSFWTYYVPGDDGVEVLDDHTVRIRLEPHAEVMDPWRSVAIMPEHLLGDVPPSELAQHPYGTRCPVGNGPFVFREHRPDASWTFVRNPGFPESLGGPPYLDRYVYRIIPEPTTLLAELLTGNIDYYAQPLPDQLRQIEEREELEVMTSPFRAYNFVGWNARRPQLEDPRVRRALTLATNREEFIAALRRGYGSIANSGVPPFHWAHYPAIADSLGYDPDQARRLLDEAGWSEIGPDGVRRNADGVRMEIAVNYNQGNQERQDIAEIMQAQLREVGVAIRPEVMEYSALLDRVLSPRKDFDAIILGWVTEFKVDDTNLFHSRGGDAPYAFSGTRNPELDLLLDTLQKVTDREEALPLWHRYQYEIIREQPYTFLYFPDRLAGVNRRLRGVELDERGEWVSIARWWIPAESRGRR